MKILVASVCVLFAFSAWAQAPQDPLTNTAAANGAEAPPVAKTNDTAGDTTLSTNKDVKKADKALAPIEKDLQDRGAARPDEAQEKAAPASPYEIKSRIGLSVGLGLPHPLTAGLDYLSPNRNYGFSLIGGSSSGTFSDTKLEISSVELQVRYHPWSSSFYLGLGAGNHSVKATRSEVISGQTVNATAKVTASYLSPQLGWIALWPNGFNIGYQIGVLLPSGSTTDVTSDAPANVQATPDYQSLSADVRDKGNQLGKTTLPYFTLLRFGWLF